MSDSELLSLALALFGGVSVMWVVWVSAFSDNNRVKTAADLRRYRREKLLAMKRGGHKLEDFGGRI